MAVYKIQIAQAASCGGAAITIHPALCDDLQEFVSYCAELKIEPVGMARTLDEANSLLSVGVRFLCLHDQEETALLELRQQLPSPHLNPHIKVAAKLLPGGDFPTNSEIDASWLLRDNGFHAVWPSPRGGLRDRHERHLLHSLSHASQSESQVHLTPAVPGGKEEGGSQGVPGRHSLLNILLVPYIRRSMIPYMHCPHKTCLCSLSRSFSICF